jgi:outer membrane protein
MKRGNRSLGVRTLAAFAGAAALAAQALSGPVWPRPASAAEPADSSTTAGSSAVAPRAITLQEAVALAQRNSPLAVQAQGQVRTAAASSRAAYAAFLPNVSLSAGATRQYQAGTGGTRVENGQVITLPNQPWSYNGSVGASVELFGGGSRLFEISRARAAASAADVGAVSQRYAVALDAKQQYFNVLAARESQNAARAQLAQAELQLTTAVARVRARSATRSDSLRAEIQVRNARLAVMDADNSLETADAGLARSVGVAYPVTAAPADSTVQTALAVEGEALRQLAEDGPAVRQAKAELDAARASRRSSWTGYLPSVTASYSRGASGTSGSFGLGADDYNYSGALRFSLSLPLFNQLQREEQVVRAQVAEENAAVALRDAQLAAAQSFTTLRGAYQTAAQRIVAQAASVEAAEEDLRVQQQRYAVGSSTLLDVLTSQTQLDQARQELIRARYDQRVAKAQLEALVGRDL